MHTHFLGLSIHCYFKSLSSSPKSWPHLLTALFYLSVHSPKLQIHEGKGYKKLSTISVTNSANANDPQTR